MVLHPLGAFDEFIMRRCVFTHEQLSAILHALVTGYPDRAVRLVYETPDLPEDVRQSIMVALSQVQTPQAGSSWLGDILRSQGAPRNLVNECYRAAFYASEEPARLARNPLFAYFLAKKGGLVLDKWPHYFEVYDRYLSRFRGSNARVLEIGVYRGGGLDLLRDYLGPEAQLVGIDIDPVAASVAATRYTVELGDQVDPDFLARVVAEHGPFDVVIDDGGHTMEQQITTASILLPLMPHGSVYIVEDTHTSYWPEYGGGVDATGTFAGWVKGLVDQVHAYHWSSEERFSGPESAIAAVHVHDSMTLLDVGRPFPPFSEVVGTWDFLKLSRPLSAIHSELLATRDVALAEKDQAEEQSRAVASRAKAALGVADEARDAAVQQAERAREDAERAREDAERAREDAQQAREDAERARLSLEQAWAELQAMRTSRSWRVTGPLRRAKRLGSD